VRVEIVAVGTELLLGQIVDTNSTWIAEQLAAAGMDCLFQTRVGDNIGRIVSVLELALSRSDAVICCGGLGPTQDDLTREAIAEVMGVPLRRDPEVLAVIESMFARRGRTMTANNARQADVPDGATVIPQVVGTAPGLICPVGSTGRGTEGGGKVVYAVPGVPHEMREMLERAILPDLRARAGETAVILSRTLRTWGLGESALAERVTPRLDALDAAAAGGAGAAAPTIAFLASGIEGIKLRVTVKAPTEAEAQAALDAEEAELRSLVGPYIFSVDEPMEAVVGRLLIERSLRLATAESFTGGLLASRLVGIPGASTWFAGGVVPYVTAAKHDVLHIAASEVVSAAAASEMATAVRSLFGAGVGLATTGVAGPDPQEGHPPGTVFVGLALGEAPAEAIELRLPGEREQVRQLGVISALDLLRRRLLGIESASFWAAGSAGTAGTPVTAGKAGVRRDPQR
jgi:nicotinamide-nucleotide amidase